jgi:hypothetical protein
MPLQKNRSTRWSFSFPLWSIPIALLILVLLSYGLRVFRLGFYWDDWPYLWFFERLGPAGIIRAFSSDRPFLSFIYNVNLSLFGHSILAWQAFALFARWLCSLGLWWALSLTWPKQADKSAWAVLLFTVYPGFTQQWISVIYGQAFILFAALFFSIGITLWLARRRPARGWLVAGTVLALALSAFTMFSTEYFFGLELLRPALLWLVFADCPPGAGNRWQIIRRRAGRLAAWWAPYLALMAVFIFWRSMILVFASYQMTTLQNLGQSPFTTLWNLFITIIKDFIVSTLVAWGQTLRLDSLFDSGAWVGLRLLGLMLFTGLLVSLFLSHLKTDTPQTSSADDTTTAGQPPQEPASLQQADRNRLDGWALQAMLVGILAVLAAGWPFWITQLPLRMGFPQDRFSLPLATGVCLLMASLVDALGKDLPRKALILGTVVALATGFHFDTSDSYREDWNVARDFFWQLTWRAPSVTPDTLFISTNLPFRYYEDDSLSAPLNWTYDPDGSSTQIKYMLYDLNVRHNNLPNLKSTRPIEKDFRAVKFSGSTSRLLVFYYSPPGCVRILDPVYDADLYELPNWMLARMSVSRPNELIQDHNPAAAPPEEIFGNEPKHRWCYFFEKADLARQNGDWETVVALSRQSIGEGYRPEDLAEYLPFIEGYNRQGYWEDAYELTRSAYNQAPKLRPALCAVWRRTASDMTQNQRESSAEIFGKANKLLDCPTP